MKKPRNYLIFLVLFVTTPLSSTFISAEADDSNKIVKEFEAKEFVDVVVSLRVETPDNYSSLKSREELVKSYRLEKAAYRKSSESLVKNLHQFGFELNVYLPYGFSGRINKEAFQILKKEPIVRSISVEREQKAILDETINIAGANLVHQSDITGSGEVV